MNMKDKSPSAEQLSLRHGQDWGAEWQEEDEDQNLALLALVFCPFPR